MTYQWQATAWNVREVMVLIVVANIERNVVQRPIVRVSLVTLLEHVMFRNEMTSDRVEPHCKHSSTGQVDQRSPTQCIVDDYIKCQLQCNAQEVSHTSDIKACSIFYVLIQMEVSLLKSIFNK